MADRFHTHGLGQVFLVSQGWIDKIVRAANIGSGDNIIEIGPGRGALTKKIVSKIDVLDRGGLILVEKDPELIEPLTNILPAWVGIENLDFMDFDIPDTSGQKFKIISNLPYSSSTQILIRLLQSHAKIERMVLMFQREVAHRILARPGTRKFGRLAAMTQAFWKVRSIGVVSPSCFRPMPAIFSEVVLFEGPTGVEPLDFDAYQALVAAIFALPRRTVENSLAIALKQDKNTIRNKLKATGIDPKIRPSDLSIEQILAASGSGRFRF